MCEAIRELRYEAMMKGEIKGREEGKREGEAKKQIEIAIKLKKNGKLSNEEISFITGIPANQLVML